MGPVLAFVWPQSPAQSRAQLWWETSHLWEEKCFCPSCSPGIAETLRFAVGVSLVESRIVGKFVVIPEHEMIYFLKSLLRNYLKEFPAFSGIHEAVDVMESWEVYQRRIYCCWIQC